ncbi:MAG TPA: TonB-dependent receptor [Bacteroides sp.]|nr:TonB-dependent receptor [Bacteroides sp.]
MKQTACITVLWFTVFFQQANGQDNDVLFSGHFSASTFSQFAGTLEAQDQARFFFLENWVRGIRITVSGEDLSLDRILSDALLPAGIYYHIDENRNVYLNPDQPFTTSLPDYSVQGTPGGQIREEELPPDLTRTEQRYIEGRKAGFRETIVVGEGNGNGAAERSGSVIYGKMTDRETGEALIGATIYIQELKKGAATDVDGRFSIVLKPGKYSADFNCMGMETEHYYLDVRSGGRLNITMAKGLIPISEVVVEASRFHHVRGMQMGFERLNYQTVKEIPVVFGEKDLLKVAKMLPGVQHVGEGSSGINVRGSGADQNMIYVNGVPLYNSSHLFGFFSSLNPDIIRDFSLYKSNLPANYGGRLASIFDISTRQGNMKAFTARGGISPVTGHVAVEGPVIREKAAFVLSARSTYSDWILRRLEDPELRESNALFYDLAGSFTYEPDEKNLIKTFGYYSKDRFSLGNNNDYAYSNAGASIIYNHRFNSRFAGNLAAVFGEYAFQTIDEGVASYAYQHRYRIDHYELKTDLTWLSLGSHRVTFGGNINFYRLHRGTVEPYGETSLRFPVDLGTENGLETALYVADEISLTPRLTLYGGIRYSAYLALGPGQVFAYAEGLPKLEAHVTDTLHFGGGQVLKSYSGPEPRIALTYLLGSDNSLKFSYNRIRQFLFMLSNTIAIAPTDQWKLCDAHMAPPLVDQVSAGYYHEFRKNGISTSLEVYHKWVSNVVEYRDGASFINSPHVEMETLQGAQRAYGVEAMIRKNTGKFNGWLGYTYSRSLMQVEGNGPGESINSGRVYPSNYDRPHNLNLVSNFRVNRRLSLSFNMTYTTGRPVTYPVSIYYMDGIQHVQYSERNKYRIPDYFRVDLSLNLEGNLKRKKLAHSYWMLNIYNLTGRKNAYSVYYRNEGGNLNGYKLSVFGRPIITLSWNFKLGNYASD